MYNGVANGVGSLRVPEKVKNSVTIWPSTSIPGHPPKRNEKESPRKILHVNIESSVIYRSPKWKQLQCPSTDKQISQRWNIKTVEYYGAIKRNEILAHATAWRNHENTVLNERSQSQKGTYCTVPFIGNSHMGKSTEKASRMGLVYGWAGRGVGRGGSRVQVFLSGVTNIF